MNKRDVAASAAVAAVSIEAMTMLSTLYLHRGETHGAIKLGKSARAVGRVGTWMLSGMKPREWVGVHLRHHANEDQPPDTEKGVLGDPHTPVGKGRFGVTKVLFGNVPMYRKAARELKPGDYPDRLAPDKWDKALFDKSLLGQAALFGAFTAIHRGNLKRAGLSLAIHDSTVMLAGGIINGLGHKGPQSIPSALVNGTKPNEDGTYTSNLNTGLSALTFGEGWHRTHHDNQGRLVLDENPLRDLGGAVGKVLIEVGLAEPGVRPPEQQLVVQ